VVTEWNSSESVMFQKSNTVKYTHIPDLWLTLPVQGQHKVKTVMSHISTRGITVGVAPHPHGNPVRRDPVPAVLLWMWSPLPRFPTVTVMALYVPLRNYSLTPRLPRYSRRCPITVQTS